MVLLSLTWVRRSPNLQLIKSINKKNQMKYIYNTTFLFDFSHTPHLFNLKIQ